MDTLGFGLGEMMFMGSFGFKGEVVGIVRFEGSVWVEAEPEIKLEIDMGEEEDKLVEDEQPRFRSDEFEA